MGRRWVNVCVWGRGCNHQILHQGFPCTLNAITRQKHLWVENLSKLQNGNIWRAGRERTSERKRENAHKGRARRVEMFGMTRIFHLQWLLNISRLKSHMYLLLTSNKNIKNWDLGHFNKILQIKNDFRILKESLLAKDTFIKLEKAFQTKFENLQLVFY